MAKEVPLKPEHKVFAQEYIFDFNATRAYKVAYPKTKDPAARSSASALLTKSNVKAYIEELQADLGKTAGISRLKVLREYQKIAFTSIAHFHNTWVSRKEFDDLTPDQKDAISEIQTREVPTQNGTIEEVKVKLFDKSRALDSINKMLGYNEPEEIKVQKVENLEELSTEELIKRAEASKKIEQKKD